MKGKTIVVISYYDRRPLSNLIGLLNSLQEFESGADFDVCIVVNRTSDNQINLQHCSHNQKILYRHNVGMNIGAWDHGWRNCTEYEQAIFLQDDCYVIKDNWIDSITRRLDDPDVGLLGEAANVGWDIPWDQLRTREANVQLPEHTLENKRANRIDVYLDCLGRYGIPAGETGYHMRSLVWAAKMDVLTEIDGFPHGNNFGECIAAEIGVTKKIEALGLAVENIAADDFSHIRHLEWNQEYPGGRFTKNPTVARQIARLKTENARLNNQVHVQQNQIEQFVSNLGLSKWKLIGQLLAGNLQPTEQNSASPLRKREESL